MNTDSPAATRLTVYMGLPGAGKSTHARAHKGDALLVTLDAIRVGADPDLVLRHVTATVARCLEQGQDVVYDGCNLAAHRRRSLLALARKHGARAHLVVCMVAPYEALGVQCARERSGGGHVPWGVMQRMVEAWPRELRLAKREGWDAISYVNPHRGGNTAAQQPNKGIT